MPSCSPRPGIAPDVSHTSLLRRAIRTAEIVLNGIDRHWIPVRRSWRLNERHYGALQGKDKKATLEEFGEEQFMQWRRSYDTPPPPLDDDSEFSQAGDARYADLPDELLPRTECLADVLDRMLPYWYDAIVPDLRAGKTVLVTAHGNSLRALVKHLDDIGEDEIVGLNIPTGIPLVYELDDDLKPTVRGGQYLDPEGGRGSHRRGGQPGPLIEVRALRVELVAQAAHGRQADRVGRVGLDLGAQALDVDVEGLGVADVVGAPDAVDQLAAGEHAAGVAQEVLEQLELLERELRRSRRRP